MPDRPWTLSARLEPRVEALERDRGDFNLISRRDLLHAIRPKVSLGRVTAGYKSTVSATLATILTTVAGIASGVVFFYDTRAKHIESI
ncbi:hypothetical protein PC117_g15423 [Phytophthora cactorum]|uniref:Uncharacterized protein n=1 Tax=Phytophthora cactorum TaxID=29920 RepID=A0A8T1CPQ2_9STRA|nr:hypothetical protein PC117_g15423 [Phytophthora cactorum]